MGLFRVVSLDRHSRMRVIRLIFGLMLDELGVGMAIISTIIHPPLIRPLLYLRVQVPFLQGPSSASTSKPPHASVPTPASISGSPKPRPESVIQEEMEEGQRAVKLCTMERGKRGGDSFPVPAYPLRRGTSSLEAVVGAGAAIPRSVLQLRFNIPLRFISLPPQMAGRPNEGGSTSTANVEASRGLGCQSSTSEPESASASASTSGL